MSRELFERVLVPVANPQDARATADALAHHVDGVGEIVIAVHIIEKAGGAPDKASVEQRRRYAEDIFTAVREGLADTIIPLDTEIRYGTDVAATIVAAAHDVDATAILFTPRGGSRWQKLLSGDVTYHLLTESDIPIVALPHRQTEER